MRTVRWTKAKLPAVLKRRAKATQYLDSISSLYTRDELQKEWNHQLSVETPRQAKEEQAKADKDIKKLMKLMRKKEELTEAMYVSPR